MGIRVITDEKKNRIIVIDSIIFKGKRAINWNEVENYAKRYKGKVFKCLGDKIYVDNKFADEYCWSNDTKRLRGTVAKAKANAIQGVKEMLDIAINKRKQENYKVKHKKDAKNGWIRYTCRFALPVFDKNGVPERYNVFRMEALVRCASDGKNYLYDFVNIKKETSKPL